MAAMAELVVFVLAAMAPLAYAQSDGPELAVPWGNVSVDDVQVTDIDGEAMTRSGVGQIVMFSSEVTNAQGAEQPYVYIIHVSDSDGIASALMWSGGTIMAGETATLPAVWIPQQTGEYEATAMLWESLDDAIALAPKSVARITVTELEDAQPPAPVAPAAIAPITPPAPAPAPPAPAPAARDRTVTIPEGTGVAGCEATNECYLPHTIEVDPGTLVTWDNADAVAHTVTSGSLADGPSGEFDSSLLLAGGAFEHTFEESGEYPYYCIVHPWMEGVVVVGEGSAPPTQVAPEPAPPTPAPPASDSTVIIPEGTGVAGCEATNECYLPHTIEVDPGTLVTWDNTDAVAHTVTAGSLATGAGGEFDSSLLLADTTFEHTFEESGEYPYYCIVHPWMDGVVRVR